MTTKISTEEQYTTALERYAVVVRLCEERRAHVDRETAIQRRTVQDLELATLVAERSTLSNAIARYACGLDAPAGVDGPVIAVSRATCHDCGKTITTRGSITRAPIAGRWQWAFAICGACHQRVAAMTKRAAEARG